MGIPDDNDHSRRRRHAGRLLSRRLQKLWARKVPKQLAVVKLACEEKVYRWEVVSTCKAAVMGTYMLRLVGASSLWGVLETGDWRLATGAEKRLAGRQTRPT